MQFCIDLVLISSLFQRLFQSWDNVSRLSRVTKITKIDTQKRKLTAWAFRRPWSKEIASPVSSRSVTNNRATSYHNSSSGQSAVLSLVNAKRQKKKKRKTWWNAEMETAATRSEATCCNQQSLVMSSRCRPPDRKDASGEHVSLVKCE